MTTCRPLLLLATLALLPALAGVQGATRSTTFLVSARVADECAIFVDDTMQAANARAAVAADCAHRTPFQVSQNATRPAPFAASEAFGPDGLAPSTVRITVTF